MLMIYKKTEQIEDIKFTDHFTEIDAEIVREEMHYIVRRGASLLLVDMSELWSIDRKALEMLLECSELAKKKKGFLALLNPSQRALTSIRTFYPLSVFSIYFSRQKALSALLF